MENGFIYFERQIQNELNKYYNQSNALKQYLTDTCKKGFNPDQYRVYRDNFFYRTFFTIPSVALLVKAAALNEDFNALASAGQNLYEETGCGNSEKSHSFLLTFSHNIHGERVFNLPPISLNDSLHSKALLQQVINLKEIQSALYNSSLYIEVLSVSYAQEQVATEMLSMFYETLFVPYNFYYTKKEFAEISEYFLSHINGLEERHAEDAKHSLFCQCKSKKDINIAVETISKFLSAQGTLWVSLEKILFDATKLMPIITTKPL